MYCNCLVAAKERAQAGDLLLLSLPRDRVVEIISKQERGIRVCSLHANQVLSEQSEFVELVLSANSPLLGQPISASDCLRLPRKTLELLLVLDVLGCVARGLILAPFVGMFGYSGIQ